MRSSTTSGHNTPTTTHTYSPSVPLSIYRELAAELQAAEAMVDSLNSQNQHLALQNQQLRQEIDKAVQTVLHLQQVVDSSPRPMPRASRSPSGVQSAVDPFPVREAGSVFSEKVFTEEEEGRYRRRSHAESSSEISGWSLAIAILLIVLTAFGAGYLIVRPLLQSR